MKARYICIEGTEGVGKTTQTKMLVDYLRAKGFKVLDTKEPGTVHAPLTMTLRGIMLDNQYDSQLTMAAREFISQAIRSVHLEKVILPALDQYDYIIQDRGILSGYAYGTGCGNDFNFLNSLSKYVTDTSGIKVERPGMLYDDVIYLTGSVNKGLSRALGSKKEFATGDAMESRGNTFLSKVSDNMNTMSKDFKTKTINVDDKDVYQVFNDILASLRNDNE